jgi:hypothetical protein
MLSTYIRGERQQTEGRSVAVAVVLCDEIYTVQDHETED